MKSFFAADKKYGSKDRKQISHLCYCFFRTGKIFSKLDLRNDEALKESILTGYFLCSAQPCALLEQLMPGSNEYVHLSLEQKCAFAKTNSKYIPADVLIDPLLVFPWKEAQSNTIDHAAFCASFFVQPDLFIRIRPGYQNKVEHALTAAQITYADMGNGCIALPNHTKIDELLEVDKEVVIQDVSSQRTAVLLQSIAIAKKMEVWDCCAASGGKSILAKDVLNNITLTVSDIRPSILSNLAKRFTRAGIQYYKSSVIDLSVNYVSVPGSFYDLVICDAPCSGSGTWSRTPEQLFCFQYERIEHYQSLQKKIVSNALPAVKKGGHLLYITCSVFKQENEEVVNEIIKINNMQLVEMKILKGYNEKADSMFAALLQKT
ncbi:MAG: Fmu (Sun) domain-containing protein [Agriterribacter sp.]